VRNEQALGVGSDLVDDAIILSQDEVKFAVVHLELVFLKQDNLCAFWNINTDSRKALSLTYQSEDLRVKVDIQLVVVGVSNDKGSL